MPLAMHLRGALAPRAAPSAAQCAPRTAQLKQVAPPAVRGSAFRLRGSRPGRSGPMEEVEYSDWGEGALRSA